MSASPREVPRPLAAFRARGAHFMLVFPVSAFGLGPLLAMAVVVSAPGFGGPARLPLDDGLALVLALAALAVGVAAHRWGRRRCNHADVFADRVLVHDHVFHTFRTVFVRDVAALDDASSDHVLLHLADGTTVAVATRGDRARLLAILVDAGVPRGDAPRPVRSRPPPRVVTRGRVHLRRGEWVILAALPGVLVAAGLTRASSSLLQGLGVLLGAACGLTLFVGTLFLLMRLPWRGRRALLFDDHVVLGRGVELAWDDVVGWRDAGHAIQLVPRVGLPRLLFDHARRIPTPTPEAWAAVEALLAERGIPRLG